MLLTIPGSTISQLDATSALASLEQGAVLLFPNLIFPLTFDEQELYLADLLSGKTKNISYDPIRNTLSGMPATHSAQPQIQEMMVRYQQFAKNLLQHLFPSYQDTLTIARTSFRPAEIAGRKAPSYRKDDTRLHVDAFPATPNQGMRLLRVFNNINPFGKPRVWRIGEPFPTLVQQFAPRLKVPFGPKKYLLRTLGVTKSLRTDYDALMLQLHDQMKADLIYQKNAQQQQVELPPGSTWIVFTDQVSHAALAGQFCLEQTFLLPVQGMQNPEASPLKVLEQCFSRKLA